MQTITFYSYKGGVGRSIALATTARQLAAAGAKVFVLDLDLEAPGQHFKFHLLDEELRIPNEQRKHQLGFLEFAWSFLRTDDFPELRDYVTRPVDQPLGKGEIHVMTSGGILSKDYWNQLAKLRWGEIIYGRTGENEEEVNGDSFFLLLKDLIQEKYKPDILLIDARTGITEVGEIALMLLADQVVFLFSNNKESLWGNREVMRALRRSEVHVEIIPVLTRYPMPKADHEEEDERALKERLRSYLNEAAADLASLELPALYVLHSDRDLERRGDVPVLGAKEERTGYLEDFLALYDALKMEERLGLSLEGVRVEAGVQEAQRLEQANALEAAVRQWRSTLSSLLKQDDASNADQLSQTLRALARTLIAFAATCDDSDKRAEPHRDEAAGHLLTAMSLRSASSGERAAASREHADLLLSRKQIEKILQALEGVFELQKAAATGWDAYLAWLWSFHEGFDRADLAHEQSSRIWELLTWELIATLRAHGNPKAAEPLLEKLLVRYHSRGDSASEQLQRASKTLSDVRFGKRMPAPMRPPVNAPSFNALPVARPRSARGGGPLETISVSLEVATPILGGAVQPRTIDEVDVIRVATLRGHLRFWWRALFAGRLQGEQLFHEERRLWGGASDDKKQEGGRSAVEVQVTITHRGEVDTSPIRPYGRDMTPGAYALFPARDTRGDARNAPQETAPRRQPGTRFDLTLRCPSGEPAKQVKAALRAFILFGGYGGRTRRGLGSFTVADPAQRAHWLPGSADRQALTDLFGFDVLAALPGRALDDLPLLAGAGLRVGAPVANAQHAWTTALAWLNDFRQGQPFTGALGAHDPAFARDRGDANRPGRSNWPESDKVRQLSGQGPWAHTPLHNNRPAWPRAGFGLPIISQFQRSDRNRGRYQHREPEPYELRWLPTTPAAMKARPGKERPGKEQDRLASPLIVKALPLANGTFAPCALWLFRGYPMGQVILRQSDPRSKGSAADFDLLVAPGDQARFQPLASTMKEPPGRRLRAAFFAWLQGRPNIRVVAP